MAIGVNFGWFEGWCWDMWGWQCVGGWHGGGVVAMVFYFYFCFYFLWLVLAAKGERGEKEETVK